MQGGAQVPVVAWAQNKLRLFLKLEIKPVANVGKAEFQDLRVEMEEKSIRVRFAVDGTLYELSQKLTRMVDPIRSKYTVTGRKLQIELFKKRPSGWKRPFKDLEGKTPKWLKTDFDRWEEDLQMSDSSEGEEVESASAKPKATAADKGADLRAALREVEEKEKREREERQKQLEESLKKGVKAPAREEVGNVDLDGID